MRNSIPKSLLILAMVTVAATCSRAAITISFNGEVDPEIDVYIDPGATATLGFVADGADEYRPLHLALLVQGPGSISGGTLFYDWFLSEYVELEQAAGSVGMTNDEFLESFSGYSGYPGLTDYAHVFFASHPDDIHPLEGILLGDIEFRCEGPGDVILSLVLDGHGIEAVYDTQVIHQLPEPAALLLLGLGASVLRKRRYG
jgi:hypothetical protein